MLTSVQLSFYGRRWPQSTDVQWLMSPLALTVWHYFRRQSEAYKTIETILFCRKSKPVLYMFILLKKIKTYEFTKRHSRLYCHLHFSSRCLQKKNEAKKSLTKKSFAHCHTKLQLIKKIFAYWHTKFQLIEKSFDHWHTKLLPKKCSVSYLLYMEGSIELPGHVTKYITTCT